MEETRKYDVAISFLQKDEPLASDLHRRLSEGLEVFVYSKKQEDLAGTDGLESFRKAFREDSRVVVVLYREGWGQTPWTRIEQGAITDRLLAEGWRWLFFVVLDPLNPLPKWLPETHIRFSFEKYGIEQAVGAIKARVQEFGGTISKLDAIGWAKRLNEDTQFRQRRRQLFASHEGVNAVREQIRAAFAEIERLSTTITNDIGVQFKVGYTDSECVITNDRVTLHITWRPRYANSLEDSPLKALEVNGRVLLPEEQGRLMIWGKPQRLHEHKFYPDLTRGLEWRWTDKEDSNQLKTAAEVGDECVSLFLDLVDRDDQGKLPRNPE